MKAAIGTLAPVFNTNRMVREYAERFYIPAAKRWDELTASNLAKARELGGWKHKVRDHFGEVRVESVSDNMGEASGEAKVGKSLQVQAVINLGQLAPSDVTVELYCGALDEDGQLNDGLALPMAQVGQEGNNRFRFSVDMPCVHSGMTGYTVRVMPRNALLAGPYEMALIRWA